MHIDTTIKTSDTVLKKIYLSLYMKGLCVRGSWRANRTATYWPPLLWPQQRFLSVLGCSTGGLGVQPLWDMFLNPASSPQLVWSSTDWISCALSYIIVHAHLLEGVTISHSFILSMVKVIISWYSSTGCTCNLHRCLSYFDSPAGSEVNI